MLRGYCVYRPLSDKVLKLMCGMSTMKESAGIIVLKMMVMLIRYFERFHDTCGGFEGYETLTTNAMMGARVD